MVDERTHLRQQIAQLRELINTVESTYPGSMSSGVFSELVHSELDETDPVHPYIKNPGDASAEDLRTGLERLENDLADLENADSDLRHTPVHDIEREDAPEDDGDCGESSEQTDELAKLETRDASQCSLWEFCPSADAPAAEDAPSDATDSKSAKRD